MLLQWCVCVSFLSVLEALFGHVKHFSGGVGFGFLVCVTVYDAGGTCLHFAPWPGGLGFEDFCLCDFRWPCVISEARFLLLRVVLTAVLVWTRGTRTSLLLHFFNNLLFLDFRTSAS